MAVIPAVFAIVMAPFGVQAATVSMSFQTR